jgi:hypothetical protein
MVSFAEIVETVKYLSQPEIKELQDILCKKEIEKDKQAILEASKKAMQEYEEGRSLTFEGPEDIKAFFNQLMNEKN